MPLPPRDLDEGARLILNPLAFAARDWLDAAVGPRGYPPQEADVSSGDLDVEARGHQHQIDVAPLVGLPAGVRAEDDGLADFEGVIPAQHVEVPSHGGHNCWINHWKTSCARS